MSRPQPTKGRTPHQNNQDLALGALTAESMDALISHHLSIFKASAPTLTSKNQQALSSSEHTSTAPSTFEPRTPPNNPQPLALQPGYLLPHLRRPDGQPIQTASSQDSDPSAATGSSKSDTTPTSSLHSPTSTQTSETSPSKAEQGQELLTNKRLRSRSQRRKAESAEKAIFGRVGCGGVLSAAARVTESWNEEVDGVADEGVVNDVIDTDNSVICRGSVESYSADRMEDSSLSGHVAISDELPYPHEPSIFSDGSPSPPTTEVLKPPSSIPSAYMTGGSWEWLIAPSETTSSTRARYTGTSRPVRRQSVVAQIRSHHTQKGDDSKGVALSEREDRGSHSRIDEFIIGKPDTETSAVVDEHNANDTLTRTSSERNIEAITNASPNDFPPQLMPENSCTSTSPQNHCLQNKDNDCTSQPPIQGPATTNSSVPNGRELKTSDAHHINHLIEETPKQEDISVERTSLHFPYPTDQPSNSSNFQL